MILHKHKTVFIHIPKCGGTSIVNQYARQHGVSEYKFASQTWSQGFATACIRGYRSANKHYMYVTNLHATYDQYALQYGMIGNLLHKLDIHILVFVVHGVIF